MPHALTVTLIVQQKKARYSHFEDFKGTYHYHHIDAEELL